MILENKKLFKFINIGIAISLNLMKIKGGNQHKKWKNRWKKLFLI